MYKILIFIIILSIIFSVYVFMKENKVVDEAEQKDFYMKLSHIRKEKSKDSNSQKTSIIIQNNRININKNNYGFKAQPSTSKEIKITEKQKEELINYILINNLNKNIKKINKKLAIGIHTDIYLQLIIEGKKTEIEIFGMVNYWRDKNKTQKRVEILEYYKKINSLLSFIALNY